MGEGTPPQRQSPTRQRTARRLTEKRQGFLIFLPQAVHARLKAEATRRVTSMSELVSTAVAQFLAMEEPPPKPGTSQPFVGEYGQTRPIQVVPAPSAPEPSIAEGSVQETFEVED